MSDTSLTPSPAVTATPARKGLVARIGDSDIAYSFMRSPLVVVAALVTVLIILAALAAPWIAPQNPFDPAAVSLMDGLQPPAWREGGTANFLLGTDEQGRDVLSTILYGARISLLVGFASVLLSIVLGVGIGLVAGFAGGWTDTVLMRLADIQLTIPALLVALLIDGIARAAIPAGTREDLALFVLIFAIGISSWPQYARVVRSGTMSEKARDYVAAARIIGTPEPVILVRHILPNILGPVLVIGTIGLALAIILEATLSFLGVGVPPTMPSLGTLIKNGNDLLFSGYWWITIFPSAALVALALSVNLLGDWLRDVLNPRLR